MPAVQGLSLRSYQGFEADAGAIVAVWNAGLGASFPLDERLWRQNTDDDPHHEAGGVILAEHGGQCAGVIRARVCRVPLGRDGKKPGLGWIGALAVSPEFQRRGIGRALLEAAEAWLRERAVKDVRLGGDPGHFFPGLPSTRLTASAFFEAAGYRSRGDACWDLARDLRGFRVPPLVDRVMARNLSFRIARCDSRHVPALLDFLQKSFPGRWLYETRLRLERERSPGDIVVLLIGSRVVGFAHTFTPASRHLGPSVYWRERMGSAWGGLGPMGVAPDVRGKGLGFALLCEAVEKLRLAGVQRMAIDWTVLLKFYGAAGFEKWNEYRGYVKSL